MKKFFIILFLTIPIICCSTLLIIKKGNEDPIATPNFYTNVAMPVQTESHTHTWSNWYLTISPTCTQQGIEECVCDCGEIKNRTISITEHNFGDWETVSPPTCSVNGLEDRRCSCGRTETRTLSAKGHQYSKENLTFASCTTAGEIKYTCSNCNQYYIEKIEKSEHSWSEATCTEPSKCSVCGVSSGNALGHSYSNGKCSRCQTSIKSNLSLPSTPISIEYYSNDAYPNYKITSVSSTISSYYASSNTISYKITVTGTVTRNSGNGGSPRLRWKITCGNTVIETNGQYAPKASAGESFITTFYVSGLDFNKSYSLKFIKS